MVVHAPVKRKTPGPYIWTKTEFHQMRDLGWFVDKRVELIAGEIIELPLPGHEHCVATDRVAEALRQIFGTSCWTRTQMPLDLSVSEPLPDVAIVGGPRDSHTCRPKTAHLVVEVSDSTLAYDRHTKSSLYAAAGISEFWIVNLVHRQLEVHRGPKSDLQAEHGWSYGDCFVLKPTDHVAPLAHPQAQILVADLLP